MFVGDSIYELNDSGNVVSKIDSAISIIYAKPNGDLILQSPNGIYCTDTAGNINWSLPYDSLLASFPTYIFVSSGVNYQKINTSNGSVVWSLPLWSVPFSLISSSDYTPDGGVIGSCGFRPGDMGSCCGIPIVGTLFKIDSSGIVLWSKTYNFPQYGLSCVKQLPSGNIITGGAFIFAMTYPYFLKRDYSAFVASVDSDGNGSLVTTTLICGQVDANNNQYLSFVDDALYVVLAMGDSGPRRDTLDAQSHCPYIPHLCGRGSDYGSDWANSFGNGLNHKYADFNGDGIIDTNDIALYNNIYEGSLYN